MERAPKGSKASDDDPVPDLVADPKGSPAKGSDVKPDEDAGKACPAKGSSVVFKYKRQ